MEMHSKEEDLVEIVQSFQLWSQELQDYEDYCCQAKHCKQT